MFKTQMHRDFQFLPTLLTPDVLNMKKPYKRYCKEHGLSHTILLYST